MAQADEIAKDIIVAFLSRSTEVRWSFDRATETGEAIGKIYTAVLQAVKEGATPSRTSKV